MTQAIEAIYERGVFRPAEPVALDEGQRVTLSVEPLALTPAEAEAALNAWRAVYDGLSETDITEVEDDARDRRTFFTERGE